MSVKRYRATSKGVGTAHYYNVKSGNSKEVYPVEISFRCTCKHHSLFPESKLPCRVVKCALRKLLFS